ncbi:MAG TPA: hypothetical protein PLZ37_15505, partial [Nitrospira sp.]|nr:hypothetical protein [Nitrospira sp.]
GTVSPTSDIETVRSEALRKVGRNVVNFQKVEACLKFLVTICNTAGTQTTLMNNIHEEAARVHREPLGNLATSLNRCVFDGRDEPVAPEDLSELWASFSLRVDGDADSNSQRKRALRALVTARNNLIHQDLARIDYDSVPSCRELIELLDAQNPRILEQLSALRALIDSFKSNIAELKAWVDSDNFLRQFESRSTDA